jgi:hypothetical protein
MANQRGRGASSRPAPSKPRAQRAEGGKPHLEAIVVAVAIAAVVVVTTIAEVAAVVREGARGGVGSGLALARHRAGSQAGTAESIEAGRARAQLSLVRRSRHAAPRRTTSHPKRRAAPPPCQSTTRPRPTEWAPTLTPPTRLTGQRRAHRVRGARQCRAPQQQPRPAGHRRRLARREGAGRCQYPPPTSQSQHAARAAILAR